MGDLDDESTVVPSQSSTVQAELVSVMVVPLGVLLVAPAFGGAGRAVVTVGLVLAEAIVLYVGYGALMRVVSPIAREAFGDD